MYRPKPSFPRPAHGEACGGEGFPVYSRHVYVLANVQYHFWSSVRVLSAFRAQRMRTSVSSTASKRLFYYGVKKRTFPNCFFVMLSAKLAVKNASLMTDCKRNVLVKW